MLTAEHGTRARFATGCDCGACEAANTAKTPVVRAIGPARMARALVAHGYPPPFLARHCGVARPVISALLQQEAGFIPFTLADAVRALYAEVRNVHPFRRGLTRGQRAYALRIAGRGDWPPPEAWDDETIDDPAAEPVIEDGLPRPLVVLEEYEWFQEHFGGDDQGAAMFLGIEIDVLNQNLKRGREMRAAAEIGVAA